MKVIGDYLCLTSKMAELERFELSNGFHHYTLSKRAPSTARTQLQLYDVARSQCFSM